MMSKFFLEIKVYLARDIERFVYTIDRALFLLTTSIYFLGERTHFMVILNQIIT